MIIDARTADLRITASRILFGKAANSGQTCVAPDYVLVPREAQAALVDAFQEIIEERFPKAQGGCLGSESYGRIINMMHFKRLAGMLKRTKGRIVLGGDMDEKRLRIGLTVVTDVEAEDVLMQEYVRSSRVLSRADYAPVNYLAQSCPSYPWITSMRPLIL